jgi:hypothetical protein
MPKTRDEINAIIRSNNRAVEVGIYRIFQLQTEDEKANDHTKHLNNVGFAKPDASYGAYLARWVEKGNSLSRHHLPRARRLCLKYSRQLTAIANGEISVPALPARMARKRPVKARPVPQPEPGTLAHTARVMAGITGNGEFWDRWKDDMKAGMA